MTELTDAQRAQFEKFLVEDLRQFQDAVDGLRLVDGSYAYPLDNLCRCWQAAYAQGAADARTMEAGIVEQGR